jgi:hypothetical protein
MPDNKSTSQWSSKIEHRNEVPNYIRSESKVINQNEDMPLLNVGYYASGKIRNTIY